MYQRGKSKHSVGLMAYIRFNVPSLQEKDVEHENSPCLPIEAILSKHKWCFVTYYNSLSTPAAVS